MSASHFINDPLTENGDIRLGVLVSHLRTEEKAIFESARKKGLEHQPRSSTGRSCSICRTWSDRQIPIFPSMSCWIEAWRIPARSIR